MSPTTDLSEMTVDEIRQQMWWHEREHEKLQAEWCSRGDVSGPDLSEHAIFLSPEATARLNAMRDAGLMRPKFPLGSHGIVIEE